MSEKIVFKSIRFEVFKPGKKSIDQGFLHFSEEEWESLIQKIKTNNSFTSYLKKINESRYNKFLNNVGTEEVVVEYLKIDYIKTLYLDFSFA